MATVITNSNITVDGVSLATIDSDTIVLDDVNNRVGIGGVPSPSVPLQVNGNINATNNTNSVLISGDDGSIEIQRTGSPYIDFKTGAGEDHDVRLMQVDNGFTISTGGNGAATERMRITSDGKVGIGTTNPDTYFHVDDQDGTGPTAIIEGGGTNQNSPANGEQTLFLKTGDGTGDLSTGIGFFATFGNTPGDTGDRRATDIRAGFDGGAWGNEYMSFHVGKGTGGTSNDAAAMTDERLKITKTAVTASVPINDDKGDVREAPVTAPSAGTFTVPSGSSGEMFRLSGITGINVNVANFGEGDIVTLVNVSTSSIPLTFDAWSNGVRIAGGDGTDLASTSSTNLESYGVATLIAIAGQRLVVNGNVS